MSESSLRDFLCFFLVILSHLHQQAAREAEVDKEEEILIESERDSDRDWMEAGEFIAPDRNPNEARKRGLSAEGASRTSTWLAFCSLPLAPRLTRPLRFNKGNQT